MLERRSFRVTQNLIPGRCSPPTRFGSVLGVDEVPLDLGVRRVQHAYYAPGGAAEVEQVHAAARLSGAPAERSAVGDDVGVVVAPVETLPRAIACTDSGGSSVDRPVLSATPGTSWCRPKASASRCAVVVGGSAHARLLRLAQPRLDRRQVGGVEPRGEPVVASVVDGGSEGIARCSIVAAKSRSQSASRLTNAAERIGLRSVLGRIITDARSRAAARGVAVRMGRAEAGNGRGG